MRLLELIRNDAVSDGPTRTALAGHERDRVDEWDSFRLLAGVHRMVLAGEANGVPRPLPVHRRRRRRRRRLAGHPQPHRGGKS